MKNIHEIYELFHAHYGDPKWWPAKTPYEVIVGAVLTQNTNWSNVEKAIANFGNKLSPEFILESELENLVEIIKPAGFYNQKARYLKAVTKWFEKYNCNVEAVKQNDLHKSRRELLAVDGIGKETADDILLYAFGFATFVVDAYTKRLIERLPIETGDRTGSPLQDYSYDGIKKYFEKNLLSDVKIYNNFHAFIVLNAKKHCKKIPLCSGCPLELICGKKI